MLEDRDYMRPPGSGFSNPFSFKGMSLTGWLIVINVAAFMLQSIDAFYLKTGIQEYLVLSAKGLLSGKIWQLFTFQFMHGGFGHVFFNCLMLYMFGKTMEAQLGRPRHLECYLFYGTLGGVFQVIHNLIFIDIPVVGASAGVTGMIAMFCLMNRNACIRLFLILPVTGIQLFYFEFFVALFFTIVPSEPGIAHAAHLGGIVGAIIYLKYILSRERRLFDWRPYAEQARSKDKDRREDRRRTASTRKDLEKRLSKADILKQTDAILDKISKKGIQSLTDKERQILEQARKNMDK